MLFRDIVIHTNRNVDVETYTILIHLHILHDLSEVSEGEGGVCGWGDTMHMSIIYYSIYGGEFPIIYPGLLVY